LRLSTDLSNYVLEAIDLQKTYNGGTKALKGVSLEIKGGTIFALLGPNGAGKTTFVRIAATQLLPSSGEIKILGHDVVRDARSVRKRIAVVPQEARPLSLQTPYEHILTYLIARGIDIKEAKRRTDTTISSLKLESYRNTICANLSGGLRQRVLIAMAMSSEADLLILDEPTLGLDPLARLEVWNLVRDYVSKDNRTILLTTHYMDEAEFLSDQLAIIDKGKVISLGTPNEIKRKLGSTNVVIVKSVTDDSVNFESYGKTLRAGSSIRIFADREKADELVSFCLKKNIDVSVRQVSLEDVFINEVGREIDADSEAN
jgi:ABC-2 type transport system ATP-binding protein